MRASHVLSPAARTLALGFAIVLLAVADLFAAQDVCKPIWDNGRLDDLGKFEQLRLLECLGGSNDRDPRVIGLRELIQTLPGREDADRLTTALGIIAVLHDHMLPECADAELTVIDHALLTQQVTPTKGMSCDLGDDAIYQTTCWEFDSNNTQIPALPKCALAVGGEGTLERNAAVLRLATVVRATLDGVFSPLMSKYHTEATELRGRWWTYFHQTRSQYPWEVLVNALDFKHKISKATSRSRFQLPPNHQWIVAHPEASLEYLKDAPDGEQLKPTVTLEVFGFNRWSWKGEKTSRAFGVAAVANYSDVATIRDWRFGAVIHVAHRYSFGATRSSGDTGYFVSADLATFIMDKKKQAKSFLGGLK
jgi:hypothetical protein